MDDLGGFNKGLFRLKIPDPKNVSCHPGGDFPRSMEVISTSRSIASLPESSSGRFDETGGRPTRGPLP